MAVGDLFSIVVTFGDDPMDGGCSFLSEMPQSIPE
jgi:hypothetical protein